MHPSAYHKTQQPHLVRRQVSDVQLTLQAHLLPLVGPMQVYVTAQLGASQIHPYARHVDDSALCIIHCVRVCWCWGYVAADIAIRCSLR